MASPSSWGNVSIPTSMVSHGGASTSLPLLPKESARELILEASGHVVQMIRGIVGQENEIITFVGLLMAAIEQFLGLAEEGIEDPYARISGAAGGFQSLVNEFMMYVSAFQKEFLKEFVLDPSPPMSQPEDLQQPATLTCPFCNEQIQALIEVGVIQGGVPLVGGTVGNTTGPTPSVKVVVSLQNAQQQWISRCAKCMYQATTQLHIDTVGPASDSLRVLVELTNQPDFGWPPVMQDRLQRVVGFLLYLIQNFQKTPIAALETSDLVLTALQISHLVLVTVADGTYRGKAWHEQPDAQGVTPMKELAQYINDHLPLIRPNLPSSRSASPSSPMSQGGRRSDNYNITGFEDYNRATLNHRAGKAKPKWAATGEAVNSQSYLCRPDLQNLSTGEGHGVFPPATPQKKFFPNAVPKFHAKLSDNRDDSSSGTSS